MRLISWRIGALTLLASCGFAATFNVKDFGAAGDAVSVVDSVGIDMGRLRQVRK
jgi:hypothetical protein